MPSIQGGIVEYVAPAQHITLTAGATIVGGNLVKISANRTVIQTAATAEAAVIGVALHNADASSVTALTVACQGVYPLTASGSIPFGSDVVSGAAGAGIALAVASTAVAADINNARNIIGMALETIGTGTSGRVRIMR